MELVQWEERGRNITGELGGYMKEWEGRERNIRGGLEEKRDREGWNRGVIRGDRARGAAHEYLNLPGRDEFFFRVFKYSNMQKVLNYV